MKVLMINGSPRPNGNTSLALREMETVFKAEGIETEIIQIGNKAIRGCIACGKCAEKGNADLSISSTLPGMVKFFRLLQSPKAYLPIVFTLSGTATFPQSRAAAKGKAADFRHTLRDDYAFQAFAAVKSALPDGLYALRDHHIPAGAVVFGQYALFCDDKFLLSFHDKYLL